MSLTIFYVIQVLRKTRVMRSLDVADNHITVEVALSLIDPPQVQTRPQPPRQLVLVLIIFLSFCNS